MASVLFLAPADLGEAVLATGAFARLLGAGDAATVVCGADAPALFRAVPGLRATHVVPEDGGSWTVWMKLARRRFDILIDGRGGFLGRALPAARRVALKTAAILRHRVEEWGEAAGAEGPLAPKLWLDEAARTAAVAIAPGPLLLLAPGGAARAKRWPWERFAAVARRLVGGPLAEASVAVLGAAPRDAEITQSVVASLDADGIAAMDLGGGVDLLAAAALTERATLCIGNDNALTHIAAAMGAPTLTLFGPTDERVRAPHGPRARTVRGRSFEAFAALSELDAAAAMEDLNIDAVEAAALELLRAGGLR